MRIVIFDEKVFIMANTLYVNIRKAMLLANFNWEQDTLKVMLVDSTYTMQNTHEFLSDIPTSARIANPVTLEECTVTADGAADARDCTFPSVQNDGRTVSKILIFKDTGTPETSPLVAYIDTATGLPLTPNGGDIIIVWDNGVNKIFRP